MILGIKGKDHPFSLYRKFGVPMALSTDDEGVSRIDLTNEYVRAVESYYLSYADLKHLVRKVWNTASCLARAFGPALTFRFADACGAEVASVDKPRSACETFLKGSEKAEQQWELERRFRVFEAGF